jgi:hypothetical protein
MKLLATRGPHPGTGVAGMMRGVLFYVTILRLVT